MTAPTLPPEPPDGTALYWPEERGLYARLVIRDDKAAALWPDSDPSERWFAPNSCDSPITWRQFVTEVVDEDTPLSAARIQRGAS